MATRRTRRTAQTTESTSPDASTTLSPRDLWLGSPHARTLADFQQLLNGLNDPSSKELDELYQVIFGAAARPENRLEILDDQSIEAYRLMITFWPKVNGEKSAAALAKRKEDAAATGQTPSRQRQPAQPVDKLNSVVHGLATHTYRFHDARPASSQLCVVEPSVRSPYLFGASITAADARISPSYTSSALEHDKAALLEAEMMVDGKPFSLALDLAANGEKADSLLAHFGFSNVARPQSAPPTGNGTVLIIQDEAGQDLHIVPNVSVNVDRALNTARYRPGSRNTLAQRSRLYLVGGSQRQNAGMLNTMMGHPMVQQRLPWQPPMDVNQAQRTLMSPRRPVTMPFLNAKTVADHPLLQLRRGPTVENRAKRALEALVDRMLKPVTTVHEVLRAGTLSPLAIERIKAASLTTTYWRQLLLGTLSARDVPFLADELSGLIWSLLERLPQAFEQAWTVREVQHLIEAIRPRQPLL